MTDIDDKTKSDIPPEIADTVAMFQMPPLETLGIPEPIEMPDSSTLPAEDPLPNPCPYVDAGSLVAFTTFKSKLPTELLADDDRILVDGKSQAATAESVMAAASKAVFMALSGPMTDDYRDADRAAGLDETLGHLDRVVKGISRLAASTSRAQRIVDLNDIEPTALAALDDACECVFAPAGYQFETFPHFFKLLHCAAQIFLLLDGDTEVCQAAEDLSRFIGDTDQEVPAIVKACKTFHVRAESYLHKVYQTAFDQRMSMVGVDYTGDLENLTVMDRASARSLSFTVPRTDATQAAGFALSRTVGYRVAQNYTDTLLVRETAHLLNTVFNQPTDHVESYCQPDLPYLNLGDTLSLRYNVETEDAASEKQGSAERDLEFVKALAKREAIDLLGDEIGEVQARDNVLAELVMEHKNVGDYLLTLTNQSISTFASTLAQDAIKTYLIEPRQVEKVVSGVLEKVNWSKASPLKYLFSTTATALLGPITAMGVDLIFSLIFPKTELTEALIKEMIGEAIADSLGESNRKQLILDIKKYGTAAELAAAHIADAKPPSNGQSALLQPAYTEAVAVTNRAFTDLTPQSNIKTHIDSRIYTLSLWMEAVDCLSKEATTYLKADGLGQNVKAAIIQQVERELSMCTTSFQTICNWINDKIWHNRFQYFPEVYWFLSGNTVYDRKKESSRVIAERLRYNYGRVEKYCAALTLGHVMNYLQLRYIQVKLDSLVQQWNNTFNTKIPGTNNAMTSWLNHYTGDLSYYANDTLCYERYTKRVHEVVDVGRYKLSQYPKSDQDWLFYLEDVNGKKLYLRPGSHADLTGAGLGQLRYMGVGLGLYAFLWTEKDFGKYFVDEEVTYRDQFGNIVRKKRPVEKRKGSTYQLNDGYRLYDITGLTVPIKSAVIAYDFTRRHGNFTWIPPMKVIGEGLTKTAEPPDVVDFRIF
ncbi:MAG: hypothetical protein EWV53_01160 [Microcystis panniformis Mp_MB_F_20051200_S9]|uniref:Uncharacterized protein n=1 Tax=Microcystis panniformis Mp_MB_F_20051200_S9 TaxID=2486223 RepID=A0A552QAQ4_9CHRO|nr:MAG: hypothetical protein EWV87_22005 [Microcystis panniformis Mp_GB_SS_20050300_S99]TRV45255.1 MAG: hypothetical protein EWV42_20150 [Microcystis panniformis Mp_GB_SS_20050300_S99D]TRV53134.1 MAG: hypothetical protein EWV43_00475 [Microcystis panniformis Mp_MB_F_20080800_S26D]TRV59597.1 MAG: hypothetical protein EWV69_11365 [Microcystis panniformis Mp_MB_F_20080800_S26]TRV61005.1 MAG: hypothetical protein EWV86_15520 [Microcystis panniformis Mp_MB_F_20051200_S9D]TRV66289.1 MAG: hypothetica